MPSHFLPLTQTLGFSTALFWKYQEEKKKHGFTKATQYAKVFVENPSRCKKSHEIVAINGFTSNTQTLLPLIQKSYLNRINLFGAMGNQKSFTLSYKWMQQFKNKVTILMPDCRSEISFSRFPRWQGSRGSRFMTG